MINKVIFGGIISIILIIGCLLMMIGLKLFWIFLWLSYFWL